MKNLTVSLDDETYRRARMIAAQRDTSVSALVKAFLVELTSGESETERLKREERASRERIADFDASHAAALERCRISAILTGALEIRAAHGFSYWDSAIIAAARALGSRILYSEDMSHGRQVEGITIINPFR